MLDLAAGDRDMAPMLGERQGDAAADAGAAAGDEGDLVFEKRRIEHGRHLNSRQGRKAEGQEGRNSRQEGRKAGVQGRKAEGNPTGWETSTTALPAIMP